MSDVQIQTAQRQERIALAAIPRLNSLADELVSVATEVFRRRVPFNPLNGADVMVLSFVTKQLEHLRSVRVLINAGSHRDALLIARTMLEGHGRLLWAFQKTPERTDLWFWFGAILDWRRVNTFEKRRKPIVDPADKAALKAKVDEHGPNYYRPSVRDGIAAAANNGLAYKVPEDPWGTNWTEATIETMFARVGGKSRYESVYRESSEWIHWGPRAILGAMQSAEWGIEGFTREEWRDAVIALKEGCESVLQSLDVLNSHFSLGLEDRLAALTDDLKTILTESVEASGR